MAEMLSPGVFVTEIDASVIAPTVSNSIAVFAGRFDKGPVGTYTLITNVDELISFYGLPTDTNYNDWYQCYNFLQYGNKLYVARADNVNGTSTPISGETIQNAVVPDTVNEFSVQDASKFNVGDYVTFGGSEEDDEFYMIVGVDGTNSVVTLDRNIEIGLDVGTTINSFIASMNGIAEAVVEGGTEVQAQDYVGNYIGIGNLGQFQEIEQSIVFTGADAKVKFMARNPGDWASRIEVAIARPDAFNAQSPSYAFDGIALDDLFEYFPTDTQIGVIVRYDEEIKEIFTVDFDQTAKDINGKSTYIENVINNQSNYLFVKDNTGTNVEISNYLVSVNGAAGKGPLGLVLGQDSPIQSDDLYDAYELWDNKEELDIDIVIANELDPVPAKNLCDTRKDCIGFIGARYADVVGKKASTAVANLIEWRRNGDMNFNNMFIAVGANYKFQYDRYNDKNRWVNIAGDIAGLRAQTSMSRASWWASAGLERGQLKGVKKLAFNPTQGSRDILYKNGLNPICSFPGQGHVMWGQKTLLDRPSSFDRVNIRGLFNTMERSLSKMAKHQVMEFNDNFTRNRIISMIKPFLQSVQAGRGIQDFLVICDESNNTPDVISRNQLVVDIYIKPTYVAEFIHLKFTNAGTNSFSEVIGG
jgi:phage tail sheath protein FI